MRNALATALIIAGATQASALELHLSESVGVGHILGEEASNLIRPGMYVSNAVLFDFSDRWALNVNYFGASRVSPNKDLMESEALATEEDFITENFSEWTAADPPKAPYDATGTLDNSDFDHFRAFSANVLWGGASVRVQFGSREGRSAYLGFGGAYFAVPSVNYSFGINQQTIAYENELPENPLDPEENISEYTYLPESESRRSMSVDAVTDRSGIAGTFSAGMSWPVGDHFRFTTDFNYMHGLDETLQFTSLGLGFDLLLP